MGADNVDAQVAILGAGPAGTAAALHLGQLGVSDVLLVDRADFPRDKTCGSGLSPKGIQCLKSLDVWGEVEPHAYPVSGLRLVTPKDRELYLSGGDEVAAVICLRRIFDEILLRRAQSLGVQFLPRFLARELLEEDGRTTGFVDGEGRRVRARFVLVADGAHSRFVVERGPKTQLQAIMGWWENVPFRARHVEMVFDPLVSPLYGWLFPESPSRVNIGICYRDDAHQKNARSLFQAFLDRQYGARLRSARQVGDWKGHPILFSYAMEKLQSPGRLILGEAGRMTHPATGEGIYQGMKSGMLAAEAVRDVIQGHESEAAAFARYQSRCKREFFASFWGAKVFQGLIESKAVDWIAKMSTSPAVQRAVGGLMAQM